ncbi:amino acid ABC transporter ATP-binding protein [Candidatus Binatia bacterium]|nr:amino acid ABC transporter ATP-binding protein [Candidatus Binatia bacterium]
MVRVRGLRTVIGGAEVVRGVDLEVGRGEVVAILGPSGAGKTTLLRGLNYLTPFTAGEVQVAGCALRPGLSERADAGLLCALRRRVGMVFQSLHLFPHLTALGNVMAAPRHVLGESLEAARAEALRLLARVGLERQAGAYPATLSGGQQQRVAIARALAVRPEVLLFDEPTSALDPGLVGEVLAVVSDLAATGLTLLIVTHHVPFARRVAHRAVVLVAGRVVEDGPAEAVLSAPASAEARALLQLDARQGD